MQQYMNIYLYTLIAPCSAFGLESCNKFGVANLHLSLLGNPSNGFLTQRTQSLVHEPLLVYQWASRWFGTDPHWRGDGTARRSVTIEGSWGDGGRMMGGCWNSLFVWFYLFIDTKSSTPTTPGSSIRLIKVSNYRAYRSGSMALQVYVLPYIV